MTQDELYQLTSEQKRLRIAEAVGWSNIHSDPWRNGLGQMVDEWYGHDPANTSDSICELIPDFPFDLNAMHKAEGIIDADPLRNPALATYAENLRRVMRADTKQDKDKQMFLFLATAAQRADAFLLSV